MKHLIIALLLLSAKLIFSQGTLNVVIIAKDAKKNYLSNADVILTENNTKELKSYKTSERGDVTVKLNTGSSWRIKINDQDSLGTVFVPNYGVAKQTKLIIYDTSAPQKEPVAKTNRENISYEDVNQNITTYSNDFEKDIYIQIKVTDNLDYKVPKVAISLFCKKINKKFNAVTNNMGVARFVIPGKNTYEIDVDGVEAYSFLTIAKEKGVMDKEIMYRTAKVTENIKNDTIIQKMDFNETSDTKRLHVAVYLKDMDFSLPRNESVYLNTVGENTVYKGTTDANGRCTFLLPYGKTYEVNLQIIRNLGIIDNSDYKGYIGIDLVFIYPGTELYLSRKAEREKRIRERDSLFKAGAYGHGTLDPSTYTDSPDYYTNIKKNLEKRKDEALAGIAKDPKYFEKKKLAILSVFQRNKKYWNSKLVVVDVTGSMSPYIDEVLIWHLMNALKEEPKQYFLFNDGDSTPDELKKIGKTGGIYYTGSKDFDTLLIVTQKAMNSGYGGDSPENDMEALLKAQKKLGPGSEIILIADNYSEVRDMALLSKLTAPVHIILCGYEGAINEDYLEIAYKTGGSVHTIEQDIFDLLQKVKNGKFTFQGKEYTFTNGSFYLK